MTRRGVAPSSLEPPRNGPFDYTAPAETFMTRARVVRRGPVAYRRFEAAADAIRFIIEEVPAPLQVGAILEVGEQRYDHQGIRDLYDRDAYPHPRR